MAAKKHILMFGNEFAKSILSGEKFQKTGPVSMRKIRAGDTLSLRQWEGKPYRSKQIVLRDCTAVSCDPVMVNYDGLYYRPLGGDMVIKFPDADALEYANVEGFANVEDMVKSLSRQFTIPLECEAIRWNPNT